MLEWKRDISVRVRVRVSYLVDARQFVTCNGVSHQRALFTTLLYLQISNADAAGSSKNSKSRTFKTHQEFLNHYLLGLEIENSFRTDLRPRPSLWKSVCK